MPLGKQTQLKQSWCPAERLKMGVEQQVTTTLTKLSGTGHSFSLFRFGSIISNEMFGADCHIITISMCSKYRIRRGLF